MSGKSNVWKTKERLVSFLSRIFLSDFLPLFPSFILLDNDNLMRRRLYLRKWFETMLMMTSIMSVRRGEVPPARDHHLILLLCRVVEWTHERVIFLPSFLCSSPLSFLLSLRYTHDFSHVMTLSSSISLMIFSIVCVSHTQRHMRGKLSSSTSCHFSFHSLWLPERKDQGQRMGEETRDREGKN